MQDKGKSIGNKSDRGFIGGVMLLSLSTLICKIIGLFFKIPMINIVGIDGMAYFSAAYNIYMLLNSVSAAGLPVALSILVSRNRTEKRYVNVFKVFKVSLMLFVVLGITGTLCLYFFSDAYSKIIGIEGSAAAVKAIAPCLLFICISGALRGYFQGHEFMLPTAVSQLIESSGKLLLGVGFALAAVSVGAGGQYTAAAAVHGLSAGVLISSVYLTVRYILYKKRSYGNLSISKCSDQTIGSIVSELVIIALPVTVSSCVTSLTSLADTALITNRLVAGGLSQDAAVTLYSSYTNLAIPLFNLPPALITAVAISLVPALTAAITRNNVSECKKVFSSSVRLSLAFSLPAAAGMAVFAGPILDMIYPNEPEACGFAAPLLSILSIAIVFSCLTTVCNAVLQAYMHPSLPIISMASGAAIKMITEYMLVGTEVGIYGAPISTLACTLTILVMDMIFISVFTPQKFELSAFIRTLGATATAVSLSVGVYSLLSNVLLNRSAILIISIAFAMLIYAPSALLFGVLRYSDISHIPLGKRVGDLLLKIRFIK